MLAEAGGLLKRVGGLHRSGKPRKRGGLLDAGEGASSNESSVSALQCGLEFASLMFWQKPPASFRGCDWMPRLGKVVQSSRGY